jgi:alkanesulfonate monooxygenase SsuD/methylene tetrahydromethanopterin reductase-like flavin-dependent oxidoreductase (luciferase family)
MKFGLSTVTRGVFSSRENYMAVAKAAERAGFDFLSVSDHLIVPGKLESHYPYTASGVFAAAEHGHCFDQLATIAFPRRLHRAAAAADVGAGGAAPAGDVDRERCWRPSTCSPTAGSSSAPAPAG